MRLIYVAGAYRAPTIHGVVRNIERASAAALALWQQGWAVICPHKNTALFDGAAPDEVWLAGDLEMLRRCDAVFMLRGWRDSRGATAEHEEAVARGLEILYEEDAA